jgi:hypothetical protein
VLRSAYVSYVLAALAPYPHVVFDNLAKYIDDSMFSSIQKSRYKIGFILNLIQYVKHVVQYYVAWFHHRTVPFPVLNGVQTNPNHGS